MQYYNRIRIGALTSILRDWSIDFDSPGSEHWLRFSRIGVLTSILWDRSIDFDSLGSEHWILFSGIRAWTSILRDWSNDSGIRVSTSILCDQSVDFDSLHLLNPLDAASWWESGHDFIPCSLYPDSAVNYLSHVSVFLIKYKGVT